ncbi:LOW QUALITY PROTEIN: P3 protein [Cyprinus carpio]|uniref:LOW QUALITY PROTEIN: P3 protein n=1 Tax=Cyprinus carpio TaxID=7962 RepID=A0A9Q9V795_CYPCA|nr:LOW QUALITY PROTEIN: P3 protein [Cyprinus carpio]
MKTVVFALSCLLLIAQAEDPEEPDRNPKPLQYLYIGDGSSQEFEFPQNTPGVIVISSRYRSSEGRKGRESLKQTVRVRSLDPDVISILNVSDSGRSGAVSSYVISIRSGVPGTAPLLIQLLDLYRDSEPVLIEERSDYSIRVAAGGDDPGSSGLAHFSENPVLFALTARSSSSNKCAFGCKVEVEVLLGLLRRPVPLLLGVAGQFLIMPLYAYGLSCLVSLPKALSLGLVITCSAPGGGGGYLYSLLLGGDVTLAISMTLISTVVAAAAMPLSSALYGRLLGVHAALHVPFVKILGTLLFIAIPISLGMLVKLRLPAVTRVLLALIRPFSFVLIVGGIFMAYQMGSSILANVQPPIVVAGVTVPVFGLLVGFGLGAAWGGMAPAQRKTVSIEVGVQNSLLALAVMQLSFQRTEADYASQAPFIVALSSTSEMLLLVLVHIVQRRLCLPPASEPAPDGQIQPIAAEHYCQNDPRTAQVFLSHYQRPSLVVTVFVSASFFKSDFN